MKYILYLIFLTQIASAQSLPALIPYSKGKMWGAADSTGKIIIPATHRFIDTAHRGVMIVRDSSFTSLYNAKGELLFSGPGLTLDFPRNHAPKDEYIFIRTKNWYGKNRVGLLGFDGKVFVKPRFFGLDEFHEGMAGFQIHGHQGFLDSTGKVAIRPGYLKVGVFREGYATVEAGYNYRMGLIDKRGREVIPCRYDYITYQKGFFSMKDRWETYTFLDKNFNEIQRPCPEIKGLRAFCKVPGIYPFRPEDGKEGFCDERGNIIVQPIYAHVDDFKNGFAKVSIANKVRGMSGFHGIVNRRGELVIPVEFNYISDAGEGFFQVRTVDALNGLMDSNGKYLVPPGNYRFGQVSEGLIAVTRSNNRCGYINTRGDTVIPFNYAGGSDAHEGLIRYSLLGKMGFMDTRGNKIIEPTYERINEFHHGIAMVEDHHKIFYIDR